MRTTEHTSVDIVNRRERRITKYEFIDYSQLSRKRPPLGHDKVVVYGRWSFTGKINKISQRSGVASLRIEFLLLLSNDLLTIIRDYVGWSLTRNRKQKNMSIFWPENWSRSFKKFKWWSLTRKLLKQYLTEKQNGCLQSGRLRNYEKWSL